MLGAPSDIVFELVEIHHSTFERRQTNLFTDMYITLEEVPLSCNAGNFRI
jgi:hypothetical protein